MSQTIYRSFKIRLYPTKQQKNKMWEHIHSCRFIWNYMLSLHEVEHLDTHKCLTGYQMCNIITKLRQNENLQFLSNISSTSLRIICKDLYDAYLRFFNGISSKPKYKSKKKSKMIYPVRYDRMYFDNNMVKIEKIGYVKCKYKYNNTPFLNRAIFINPRISFISNKWILSFSMEYDVESQNIVYNTIKVGIDLGVKEQAVVYSSDDNFIVFHNINKSKSVRKLKQRIKTLQHSISRKYEYSKKRNKGRYIKTKNIIKQEKLLRRLYNKLSNIRHNYLHQVTHQIIKLNPSVVIMEDLNIQKMMKNKYLSSYIYEQNFFTFREMMRYKCEFNNIQFILVDKYFPSSKMCNKCGNIKSNLQLSDRTYVCECCGNVVDRDLNAAINLCRYDFHFEENQS